MPLFAKLVKKLHTKNNVKKIGYEIIAANPTDSEVVKWLDIYALRWPWGKIAFDGDQIIHRSKVNEEVWSGDVIRNQDPRGLEVIHFDEESAEKYLGEKNVH